MTDPKSAAELRIDTETAIMDLINFVMPGPNVPGAMRQVAMVAPKVEAIRTAIDAAVEAARREGVPSAEWVRANRDTLEAEIEKREQAAFRRGAREALNKARSWSVDQLKNSTAAYGFCTTPSGKQRADERMIAQTAAVKHLANMLDEYADPPADEKGDLNGLSK